MSKKKQFLSSRKLDSPYRRMVFLVVGLILAIGVLLIANTVARGLGGHEKKIAEALFATIEQPYISGKIELSQQSQTDSFDMKGSFKAENLSKVSAEVTARSKGEGRDLVLPVKLYTDLKKQDAYLHASNVHEAVGAISAAAPQLQGDLSAIADRIDGKWLHLPQQNSKMNICTSGLADVLTKNPEVAKELVSVYTKNRFLAVDDVKDKGRGEKEYTVHADDKVAKKFLDALKAKEFFKSTKSCDASYDPLGLEQSSGQPQSPQVARTSKLTVADGKIVSMTYVSSAGSLLNSSRLDFNFTPTGNKLTAPTEGIVEYAELQPYVSAIGSAVQQQAANQQGSPQLSLPQ